MSENIDKGFFQNVNENLSRVFRHILPGMTILGISFISKIHWFSGIDLSNGNHLLLLGSLSLVVGNALYVTNRYTIFQVYDYVLSKHVAKRKVKYSLWLAEHIIKIKTLDIKYSKVLETLFFKHGQIFFIMIIGQALIVFVYFADPISIFNKYKLLFYVIGVILCVIPFWHIYLSFVLEEKLKENK